MLNGEKRVKRLCHLCLRQLKGSRSKTFFFFFFGTAPRSEGGWNEAVMPHYHHKSPSQCHGDRLSCHSNLCYIWRLSAHPCVVALIKANRLAHGQRMRSSLRWLLLKRGPQDGTVASITFFLRYCSAVESRLGAIEQLPLKKMLPASLLML